MTHAELFGEGQFNVFRYGICDDFFIHPYLCY